MKRVLTMMLLIAGLAAGAQTTERTNNFNKQVARTSFVNWEWVDKDSTRAYQDTVPGIYRLFHKDNEPGFRMELVSYYYDLDPLYEDETMKYLIRDWLSFDFDSVYYHDIFDRYTEYSADSLKADYRKTYGAMWNEPYLEDSMLVTMDQAMLQIDTLRGGAIYMILSYMKIMEDSTDWNKDYTGESLYDKMEMDESQMFGVLAHFDFSGQWLGSVHNVLYDTATLDPLSYYTMDSMMLVEFPLIEGSTLDREVQSISTFNEGALGGTWNTQFVARADSSMMVHANFGDPDWAHVAKLIWVDFDTLRYIVQVADVANEEMGNEIPDGQRFAWVWEFVRMKAIKEE
jgi:hypothetical protein